MTVTDREMVAGIVQQSIKNISIRLSDYMEEYAKCSQMLYESKFDDDEILAEQLKTLRDKELRLAVYCKNGGLHLLDETYQYNDVKIIQYLTLGNLVINKLGKTMGHSLPVKIHTLMGRVAYLATLCAQHTKLAGGDGEFSWLDETKDWL